MNLDRIIAVRNNKTVYRDGERCLKVFGEGYTKAEILNEARNQELVLEAGINVPEVLEITDVDGKWAIVYRYIKGKTVEQLMKEQPENREKLLSDFVDLQVDIHSKTCPELTKLKDKMNRRICKTDLPATVRYSLHEQLESTSRIAKVCHGDFEPSNVIISEDGTPFVIDWSHAAQGDAAADAARTFLLFWLNGDITGAEEYLKMFCEKSKTEIKYVKKWMPMVSAVRMLNNVPAEREFLYSWIDA